jgi:hypothetical protein
VATNKTVIKLKNGTYCNSKFFGAKNRSMADDFKNEWLADITNFDGLIITAEKKCDRPVILFDGAGVFKINRSKDVAVAFLNITGSNLKIDGREATRNRERETGRNLN